MYMDTIHAYVDTLSMFPTNRASDEAQLAGLNKATYFLKSVVSLLLMGTQWPHTILSQISSFPLVDGNSMATYNTFSNQ